MAGTEHVTNQPDCCVKVPQAQAAKQALTVSADSNNPL